MVLFEIFSSSFLLTIAVIVILVGATFTYLNHRMNEQDQKLQGMLSLITTMAQETSFFRSKLSSLSSGGSSGINTCPVMEPLIEVSDDEEDEDEDEEDEEDEEEDEEDEEDEEEEEDEEDEEEEEDGEGDKDKEQKNPLLYLDISNVYFKDALKDLDTSNELHVVNELDTSNELHAGKELESVELMEEVDGNLIKNITITAANIEEEKDDGDKSKVDYKSLSIHKLREMVVSKGLTMDASKLKKNDIFKLLGKE